MISPSELTDKQKESIQLWADEGADLGEIQSRFADEFEITMTYLDVRMLVADLGIVFKEEETVEEPEPEADAEGDAEDGTPAAEDGTENLIAGRVKVSVNDVAPPGMVASGSVRFSDGEEANWYFDEQGRLGLEPSKEDYRPSDADVSAFQDELQRLAQSQGL